MIKDRKKIFIKETLKNRKYFSYRTDLVLYKLIFSVIVFLAIYFKTNDAFISVLISAQVFIVFTLINKMNISRKKKEGEELLITKIKREHFKNKIYEINVPDFEMLIGFLFEREGWKNFLKKGRHMYLAEKDGIINCIKIFKLYEEMEVETIDIRNVISFMIQNNIRKGYIIVTSNLGENAKNLIDKFNNKIELEIIYLDELQEMMEKHNILPDEDEFYKEIYYEQMVDDNKEKVKSNILDNKKILVYVLASVFFYISSLIMPENNITKYIFYYFAILTAIVLIYNMVSRIFENDFKG